MKITIFGYSDDNIEIRGDLGEDEFGAYKPKYLHFDDGTIVYGGYSVAEGKGWTIRVEKLGEGATATHLPPEMDGGEHFSDVLALVGNFTRKPFVSESKDGPTKRELFDLIGDADLSRCTRDQLLAAVNALGL